MMPPTGLTLIVHTLVITLHKIAKRLNLHFPKKLEADLDNIKQATYSLIIISSVGIYIVTTVFSFLYVAVVDDRATWRMTQRSVSYLAGVMERSGTDTDRIKSDNGPSLTPEFVNGNNLSRKEITLKPQRTQQAASLIRPGKEKQLTSPDIANELSVGKQLLLEHYQIYGPVTP